LILLWFRASWCNFEFGLVAQRAYNLRPGFNFSGFRVRVDAPAKRRPAFWVSGLRVKVQAQLLRAEVAKRAYHLPRQSLRRGCQKSIPPQCSGFLKSIPPQCSGFLKSIPPQGSAFSRLAEIAKSTPTTWLVFTLEIKV